MRPIRLSGLTVAYLGLCLGCGDSGQSGPAPETATAAQHVEGDHGHDHAGEHNHPTTLDAGLKELVALRDTVRDAFAKNDTDTAHGPLHDVGHLLEDITGLVEKQGLSAEATATAKLNIETLFDSFGAVDKTMHGQEGSTYSEVSAKIDAAIQSLQSLASGDTAAPEAAAPASEPAKDDAAKSDAAENTSAPPL